MATYNTVIKKRNAANNGWDSILPITTADNVLVDENGRSVKDHLAEKASDEGLGHVMVDNDTIIVDENGKISVNINDVDYEEGVFTPFINFGGATTGIVYNEQVGRYTKIGRLCFGSFFIRLTSKGSATGNVAVGGMPFSILDAVPRPHFIVGRTRFLVYPSGASNIAMEFLQGTKSIALYGCGSDMDSVRLTDEHFKNNTSIYGTFFYAVNS